MTRNSESHPLAKIDAVSRALSTTSASPLPPALQAAFVHYGGTKNGFLFLDTCHAGAIKLDTGAARINQESGRYILVASQSVQEALDSFDGKNGVFAYAVIEGLKGKARQSATGPVDDIDLGF